MYAQVHTLNHHTSAYMPSCCWILDKGGGSEVRGKENWGLGGGELELKGEDEVVMVVEEDEEEEEKEEEEKEVVVVVVVK